MGLDFDMDSIGNRWFFRGRRATFLHWLLSVLGLIIIVLPVMIILHVVGTPIYMYSIIQNTFHIDTRKTKTPVLVLTYVFTFFLLYVFVPYIIMAVVVPLIVIFTAKKISELIQLCKNKCKYYHKLDPSSIITRHMRRINFKKARRPERLREEVDF